MAGCRVLRCCCCGCKFITSGTSGIRCCMSIASSPTEANAHSRSMLTSMMRLSCCIYTSRSMADMGSSCTSSSSSSDSVLFPGDPCINPAPTSMTMLSGARATHVFFFLLVVIIIIITAAVTIAIFLSPLARHPVHNDHGVARHGFWQSRRCSSAQQPFRLRDVREQVRGWVSVQK